MLKKIILMALFVCSGSIAFAKDIDNIIKDKTAELGEVESLSAQIEKREGFSEINQNFVCNACSKGSLTEYIMRYVVNSKTLLGSSPMWAQHLFSSIAPFHTKFVHSHSEDSGLNKIIIECNFTIAHYDNNIVITSSINYTETSPFDESEYIVIEQMPDLITEKEKDLYSKAEVNTGYSVNRDVNNKDAKTLSLAVSIDAETKISYKLFMQKVREYKK